MPVGSQAQIPNEIPFQVITTQNAVMRQYAPPLARPKSLGGAMGAPIAGIPAERLGETRFRLASVDLEGATTLKPSLFVHLWQGLIRKQITLLEIKTVLEGIEKAYRQNDYRAAAIVPQQDFASGQINIVVREFHIKEPLIRGDTRRLRVRLTPFSDRTAETPIWASLTVGDVGGRHVD
jgi:hemolysin activation/secretion protein